MSRPIHITGVAKTYATRNGAVESLKPIDLQVEPGEFVVIVGPSGCGKSTLLKIVAGLTPASAGRIAIGGRLVDGPLDDVGIVFQTPVLLAWRNLLQNLLLPAQLRGEDLRPQLPRARQLLQMAGLAGFEDKLPWQLSGGMQQRVAICRALLGDPSILLMDEPFGALDAMTREQMNLELQRIWLQTRKTVLLITHSIPEAVFLADRVLVMSERPGRVAAVYDIDLPRPRPLDIMGTPRFAELTQTLRRHFFAQGQVDG
jgi:NitT/TauT family transport system ATP-binding protein